MEDAGSAAPVVGVEVATASQLRAASAAIAALARRVEALERSLAARDAAVEERLCALDAAVAAAVSRGALVESDLHRVAAAVDARGEGIETAVRACR